MKHLLCLALLSLALGIAQAAPLTIVQDGQPRAHIFCANEPQAQKAAAEIQKYVQKMSGASLTVFGERETTSMPVALASIYVGHTDAAKAAGIAIPAGFNPAIRPEAFEEEGYVLKTKGNSIYIGGNSDGPYKGTLFAAYAFLEKLGCRWYFPGEWGEIVPQQKTITVPDLNVESRPDFPVRGVWLSGWVPTSPEERQIYDDWCNKIGFNSSQFYPLVGDGFLAYLLPPNEYYEQHPEYFGMDKAGSRKPMVWSTGKFYENVTMLCLSNPDVFTESVKNLRAAFAGERKLGNVSANGFGISPPDGAPFCYCENCLKASQDFNYPGYVQERMMSEEFFGFAAKLAKEFPDKYVATMSYSLREMPPQGVTLPPNVSVMYAPIACCVLHTNADKSCWRRQEFVEILTQWRRQTPHVTIYDYNPGFLTGLFVPERDVANFTVNAPIYKEIGIKGFAAEGRKAFMQTWLSYYVRAKLLWDAKTDVAALKQDFYTTFFGPEAGPHVQAWWDACEAALANTTMHCHEDFLVNHVYTTEFVRGIRQHVDAALKANSTEEQKRRVEAFALIADHLDAYAAMEEGDKQLDYAKAAQAAARMGQDKQKLHDLYSFFISLDPNVVRTYFSEGRQKKYEELAAMSDGTKGTMVAPLPLEARFVRDRFNEGVVAEWYAPAFNDKGWGTESTFLTWDAQDKPEDAAGHDYNGYGWYRATMDVPAKFKGQPVHFWSGGAINEAWVWVNGRYAGHKPHQIWWMHPHDFDLDVTGLVQPGENVIAIRVWNDAEIGGLYRRGFFWSPK